MKRVLFVSLLLIVALAACAEAEGSDPADAVERYLQAKIDSDAGAMRPLLCSGMEADLTREAASFSGIDARIEGMDCAREGDSDVVTCSGAIMAVYGVETTEFPLTAYQVVQEDGEWKWCGEAE